MSKKVIATKSEIVKSEKLTNQNLSDLSAKIEKSLSAIPEKTLSQRSTLYIYPEFSKDGKTKFAGNKNVINGDEGKGFRNKLRKTMQGFAIDAMRKYQSKDNAGLNELKEKFMNHYKSFYSINDLSLRSISSSSDSEKNNLISIMLEIFKGI